MSATAPTRPTDGRGHFLQSRLRTFPRVTVRRPPPPGSVGRLSVEDKRGADPVREIQRKDLKELMTKGLSRAERLIIVLYYFEEMTMKEIGATLDLSESRVSQMHSSILARLRAQMADRRKEFQQAAAV